MPTICRNLAARTAPLRVGIRPMPADGRPIVGPMSACPGLYVMITHGGVTLGPLLEDLVAEEIVPGGMPALLAPYRYERFGSNWPGSDNCNDTATV